MDWAQELPATSQGSAVPSEAPAGPPQDALFIYLLLLPLRVTFDFLAAFFHYDDRGLH